MKRGQIDWMSKNVYFTPPNTRTRYMDKLVDIFWIIAENLILCVLSQRLFKFLGKIVTLPQNLAFKLWTMVFFVFFFATYQFQINSQCRIFQSLIEIIVCDQLIWQLCNSVSKLTTIVQDLRFQLRW